MEFIVRKGDLQHLATMLLQLDAVTASPSRNAIIAGDYTNTRRLVYTPEDTGAAGVTDDVGLDASAIARVARRAAGDTKFTVTGRGLVVESGSTRYRLNLLPPVAHGAEPAVTGTGSIRVQAADMHAALKDVQAAGTSTVVIAIANGVAVLRGEGGNSIDCWIPIPGAEPAGTGYSRLSLDMLLPCMPKTADRPVDITLAPKGPTAMRFGGSMAYYQAPRK